MFWRLVLVFILLPALDLLGLLFCSNLFGLLGFVFIVIAILGSGVLGAFLARYQGLRCWIEFNRQLDRGESPTLSALHGILILLAAVLLIVPGLLTDFMGLLLLVPPVRSLLISHLQLRFEAYRAQTSRHPRQPPPNTPDIIDVE
ncbi:MAG: FxsA family protein [Planctomycetaceae bacterium]|nr:FxsA family protein [Planctomycetaceae bacterium]